MPGRSSLTISLAAKCRFLFGLAVLLIIATALLVPWYYMERLVAELNVRAARHFALTARDRLDPTQPDWDTQQQRLEAWWKANADELQLPPVVPRYVRVVDPQGRTNIPDYDPFLRRAIETLKVNSQLRELTDVEKAEDAHALYRLALAVRGPVEPETPPVLLGIVAIDLPSYESDAQLWPNRIVIITAGALAGILAILVFYLVTHKLILSPIHDLKSVVDKVAAGDLDVRSTVATADEFEQLATAINDMLANLQKSQNELRTINRSLDTRLGELAETNVSLFEANRLKSEFLANVSHELRTPLTSIIGFAELLRDAAHDSAKPDAARLTRYAHNILTSGRMLLDLINDLLDLAKIEAGRMEIHRTHFSIRDIFEALIDFTRPLVDSKNLILDLRVADDLPAMHSDAGKIQQILYNLLSNAIKFTPEGGRIRLEAAPLDEEHVRLVVADTGPGIPEELQQSVFEKFRQIDASVTREYSGTGLGLPISKELTQMLGGTLALHSPPGQGATFTVTLPVECPEKSQLPLVRLT
jgi:two-component system sensor histidine kinase BarA